MAAGYLWSKTPETVEFTEQIELLSRLDRSRSFLDKSASSAGNRTAANGEREDGRGLAQKHTFTSSRENEKLQEQPAADLFSPHCMGYEVLIHKPHGTR